MSAAGPHKRRGTKQKRSAPRRRLLCAVAAASVGLALLGLAGLLVGRRSGPAPGSGPHMGRIRKSCDAYGVDPHLAVAVLEAESSGRPRVVSRSGAIGLMQLMPATARACAKELGLGEPSRGDLFDPDLNVRLGVYYLSKLGKRFGDEREFVIAAYHAGPTRVDRWRKERAGLSASKVVEESAPPATRAYVRKVMRRWKELGP